MKKTILKLQFLSMEDDDGLHLNTSIFINGKKANMIVDTGASKTVFDSGRIKQFTGNNKLEKHKKQATGLGTNTMQSHSTMVNTLRLKNVVIKNYVALLLDLSHVNSAYKKMGMKAIDGVLGGDILNKHKAIIDYRKKTLQLFY